MKAIGVLALLIVGYLLLKYYGIIKSNTSGTGLGTPTAAGYSGGYGYNAGGGVYNTVGPQGPNDGSNNPTGNGETVIPFDPVVIAQPAATRGFRYVNAVY